MATFKRLTPEDFIISSDAISGTVWSNNNPLLTTFFTSSTQISSSSGPYYLNVYNTSSSTIGEVQFSIAYANQYGSGSTNFNSLVDGKSPSSTTYHQYKNLILGDETNSFIFNNITSSDFFIINIERTRYKEKLFLGSLTLNIQQNPSSGSLKLTDNSAYVDSIQFTESGRIFQLISGSAGVKASGSTITSEGYSLNSGSYGWFLPDVNLLILNPKALSSPPAGGGIGFEYSGSAYNGSLNYDLNRNAASTLYRAISGSSGISLNSEETISSNYVFINPKSAEFNYSSNPSFISGSTGEVLYSNFINSPQTFISTVGLYNDNNELLAVAKLSTPLIKDFTKSALIRIKMSF